MELQFFKKTEATGSNDQISIYYVLSGRHNTLIMMNEKEPRRYIISCLPGPIEVTDQMETITKSEFLAAATLSNNAACWYIEHLQHL